MDLQKHLRFLLFLVYAALILAALAFVLPGALPFLLALILSSLLEPPVRFLSVRTYLRRPWAAFIVLVLFSLLLFIGCAVLLRRLWYELGFLRGWLPSLTDMFHSMESWTEKLFYRLTISVSPSMRDSLESSLETILSQIHTQLSNLSAGILNRVAAAVTSLPAVGLFLFTTLLASFFILAGRPALLSFFRRQIPERWLPRMDHIYTQLKNALGGWLRAQAILMGITFLLLGVGFLWMGVEPAILLAASVALLDALPVFGTGTVLFPWAVIELLVGNFRHTAALLALYALIWMTRSLLEPKLIADRAGLHPLAALFAMYLGFTLFGIAGMILAPLAAVIFRQLHDSDIIKLWK